MYLARSISGDFAVQVRQVTCSKKSQCNQAIRIKYGNAVIAIDSDHKYVW